MASTGPRPMISGLRPVTPLATMRASGVMPSSWALVSLMTTTAAAPSLSGQALPAVTVPPSRKTGLRAASPSRVVPARGPSSLVTTVPSAGGDRDDLPLEEAGLLGGHGPVLRLDGELVLLLTADLLELGDVLRGLAHGDVHVGEGPRAGSTARRRPGCGPRCGPRPSANSSLCGPVSAAPCCSG